MAFVKLMADGNREAAKAMVEGAVAQTDGTGMTFTGGPHGNGPFPLRIVPGQDGITKGRAFELIESCRLHHVRDKSEAGTAKRRLRLVYYCPTAMWRFFNVTASTEDKVSLSGLGQHPVVVGLEPPET